MNRLPLQREAGTIGKSDSSGFGVPIVCGAERMYGDSAHAFTWENRNMKTR